MNINNDAAKAERDRVKKLADGKIKCQCGNDNWEQFLYIGLGDMQIGGCKRCGTSYSYQIDGPGAGLWFKRMDGPAGPQGGK
jgi:hypothetical protein